MSHQITKQQSQQITNEIREAIDQVLAAHGMEATNTRTTYGDHYEIKVTAVRAEIGESGINENTPEAIAYKQIGHLYGLNEGALGAQFTNRGEKFTFIGISTRSPKYPILAKTEDGRTMKFTEAAAAYINSALTNA